MNEEEIAVAAPPHDLDPPWPADVRHSSALPPDARPPGADARPPNVWPAGARSPDDKPPGARPPRGLAGDGSSSTDYVCRSNTAALRTKIWIMQL